MHKSIMIFSGCLYRIFIWVYVDAPVDEWGVDNAGNFLFRGDYIVRYEARIN